MSPKTETKNMKIEFNNLRSLEAVGISVLTGERDNTMTGRLLCDLNQDGVNLLVNYFGLNRNCGNEWNAFESNWNNEVNGQLAVRSVMLPRELFKPIAVFACIVAPGSQFVYANTFAVWTDDEELWNTIDKAWAAAVEKAKDFPGREAKEFVPSYLRDIERWRGLHLSQINQTHAMSGRK